MKIYSFEPISNTKSKVLVLGTMPGEKSLKLKQYYGHGGNSFWKIIFALFDEQFSTDYNKKKDLLLKNNIALWDVLQGCEREGSSDSSILKEEPNDFSSFFENHPGIKLIAFNGQNAERYFLTHSNFRPEITYISLPSTSPANTWKSFDEKLTEWKIIKKYE
jgi:hypoxanthine-DNA glycosylase